MTTNTMTTEATTVTISDDPSHLGPEGTIDELQRYARRLQTELEAEFDDEVEVQLGSVFRTEVNGSASVEARVREIEAGTEWMQILLRACDS
jgi:hypothetical protein